MPALTVANIYDGVGDVEPCNIWMSRAVAEREGRVVLIKVSADDVTRTTPTSASG